MGKGRESAAAAVSVTRSGAVEGGLVRCLRTVMMAVGSVAGLMLAGGVSDYPAMLGAQTPAVPGRLSVRPHEMTLGTRTERAGEQTLDSLPGVLVYVPKQCVGSRRCPLVVFLHGGGWNARGEIDMQSQLADKYGMVLVASDYTNSETVDAEMRQILRKFAIDPDRIALAGGSVGAGDAVFIGRRNLDVFSRIAPLQVAGSAPDTVSGTHAGWPQNTTTQFFISAVFNNGIARDAVRNARMERREGHAVKLVLGLYSHTKPFDEHDYMWSWLRDSWADSSVTARPVTLPPLAPLSTVTVTKMMTFWTNFRTEPDSIQGAAGKAHEHAIPEQKAVPMLVGRELMWVYGMVDMSILGARYPSVADALKAAGLTAQEEEAYRVAFISAEATRLVGESVEPASVLGKNVAFISTHPAVINALADLIGVPR